MLYRPHVCAISREMGKLGFPQLKGGKIKVSPMESEMEQKLENNQAGAVERKRVVLSDERSGVLGLKAGMTQVFDEAGNAIAVTVIDLSDNVVTQVKSETKEGYSAVQVGFLAKKASRATRPEQGHVKAASAGGFYHYQEFRVQKAASLTDIVVGSVLSAGFVKEGDLVDLTAISKGKGYQGGMKRYHMHGGFKTHGASVSHRSLGSIGNRADPAKVFKNKKMAGHMGHEQVTVQNVRVVRVDLEAGVLLVHGSVPGPKSGVVTIRKAVKA
jgi:large subunit ribosomal protein L3